MDVVPTILEKSFDEAERKIGLAKDLVNWIQIDVIDGVFCFGKTFELELIKKLEFDTEDKSFEIHLMVKEPIKWITKCNFVGAARVLGQVEMMENREEFVRKAKDLNMEAGVAFDIETEIGEIPAGDDMVLLMGRKAGIEPGKLDQRVFDKIEILRQAQDDRGAKFEIGVDGGVNKENIKKLKKAGVDVVYCGSAIFSAKQNLSMEENLEVLKNKANEKNQ